jgi:type IV pilus assembly protein PilA
MLKRCLHSKPGGELAMRKRCREGQKGFTLIELMIVVAIIGILAAIAIPQFAIYRISGFNATAESDLRHLITAQEAYFSDRQTYATATVDLVTSGYMHSSPGVSVNIGGANATSYSMTASHSSGDRTWSVAGPGGRITY